MYTLKNYSYRAIFLVHIPFIYFRLLSMPNHLQRPWFIIYISLLRWPEKGKSIHFSVHIKTFAFLEKLCWVCLFVLTTITKSNNVQKLTKSGITTIRILNMVVGIFEVLIDMQVWKVAWYKKETYRSNKVPTKPHCQFLGIFVQ